MIFNCVIDSVRVNIDVPAGIYLFNGQAGTGKTRLARLLMYADMHGLPVASYSYYDYYKQVSLKAMLESDKYKLILLDRYDM